MKLADLLQLSGGDNLKYCKDCIKCTSHYRSYSWHHIYLMSSTFLDISFPWYKGFDRFLHWHTKGTCMVCKVEFHYCATWFTASDPKIFSTVFLDSVKCSFLLNTQTIDIFILQLFHMIHNYTWIVVWS